MQPSTPAHRGPRSLHGGDVWQWGVFVAAMVEGQAHCVAADVVTAIPANSNAAANHATPKRLSHRVLMSMHMGLSRDVSTPRQRWCFQEPGDRTWVDHTRTRSPPRAEPSVVKVWS